jgi:nucleoside-diphosphate-sugar epimerase
LRGRRDFAGIPAFRRVITRWPIQYSETGRRFPDATQGFMDLGGRWFVDKLDGMRVFVTGATGVVGRRLVPLLIEEGHEVTAVVRSPEQGAELTEAGAGVAEVSLFDRDRLRDAVAGHDAVVNLATHIPSSTLRMLMPGGWNTNDEIRRVGSANLVEAALAGGVGRFVQESFAPIYVDRGDLWIDEAWRVRPERYARTVLDAEQSVRRFIARGGTGIVLRFGAFYGPDAVQLKDLMRSVRFGFAPLPGRAATFVSSLSHDDAAAAVVAALAAPAGTYNVTDNEPMRHRDYVDALADALGVRHPRLMPAWTTRLVGPVARMLSRSQRISNRKLRGCGWKPKYESVREGFQATVAAMK